MSGLRTYEDYPRHTVGFCNAFSVATYVIGAFVVSEIGSIWLLPYLLLIVGLEIRLLRTSCTSCYYFGKWCAFGRGKISALLFKRRDVRLFTDRKIDWKGLLPDLMVPLIPVVAGIVLLVLDFHWLILTAVISLSLLATAGSGFVRGSLACKMCRQREIGCPAQRFFTRK